MEFIEGNEVTEFLLKYPCENNFKCFNSKFVKVTFNKKDGKFNIY